MQDAAETLAELTAADDLEAAIRAKFPKEFKKDDTPLAKAVATGDWAKITPSSNR